jgi:hypothetical protein
MSKIRRWEAQFVRAGTEECWQGTSPFTRRTAVQREVLYKVGRRTSFPASGLPSTALEEQKTRKVDKGVTRGCQR